MLRAIATAAFALTAFAAAPSMAFDQAEFDKLLDKGHCASFDLSEADLSGETLMLFDLTGADLTKADLAGANLTRVDMSSAILTDANLSGAIFCNTIIPNPHTGSNNTEMGGC